MKKMHGSQFSDQTLVCRENCNWAAASMVHKGRDRFQQTRRRKLCEEIAQKWEGGAHRVRAAISRRRPNRLKPARTLCKELRLFPGREVAARFKFVGVHQFWVRPLRPGPWNIKRQSPTGTRVSAQNQWHRRPCLSMTREHFLARASMTGRDACPTIFH